MFFSTLIYSVIRLLDLLSLAIVIYAVMSWFARGSNVYYWFSRILEPILAPFRMLSRKLMERSSIPLDLSCWMAIIAIRVVTSVLTRLYYSLVW